MAEEYTASKNRPIAIGIAAAVGVGAFYLMRKRARVCYDLPEIWSSNGPTYLTDEAHKKAEVFIAKHLHKSYRYGSGKVDAAELLCDTANHLQECRWEEIESDRAKQVYEGIGKMISTMMKEMDDDPQGFMARYGL